MWLLRRAVISVLQVLIRIIFYPWFAYLDFRNAQELKRHGDVLSKRQLRDATTGTFCVFHLFPRQKLPASAIRALKALEAQGVNLVIISNGAIPEADLPLIDSVAHTVIVRRNIGRDFGGYRTGVLHVLDTFQPERILIVNDSVFYRSGGLEAFFTALSDTSKDYVGAAENHEFGYHVGSYALGFGPRVFQSPHFRKFWENYQLSELRPKVIRTGEIALNRTVIGAIGVNPTVVYSPRKLGEALAELPTTELILTASQMPGHFNERDALRKLHQTASQWFETRGESSTNRDAPLPIEAAASLADTDAGDVRRLVSANYRKQLERSLMDFVFRGSQIHWGALPLVKHLNCPIIKADLVLRGIYGVGELSAFAPSMSAEEYDEFFAMCTRRGVPQQHWNLAQRMMLAVGYI
ncbi:rhamnan synthesis F family protein [Devosia sp. ZB163]|uniref:rhamnan synthesis F family protein n=1 Tax=Devosia sp. ZB163 TaxID=3025938 RepID=UPI00235EF700|nr:rhamnan synthesis F family protein [Devosia sp. ZB163]MDC9823938.1 rhamnan synthesis F family protein [Devosia sp. ZB163]